MLLSDGCASVFAPKTLRASMGAAVRVPVMEVGAMPAAIAALRAKDSVMTAVTAVREGADDVYAEAKAINAQRTEAETANVVEDTSAEEESQAE